MADFSRPRHINTLKEIDFDDLTKARSPVLDFSGGRDHTGTRFTLATPHVRACFQAAFDLRAIHRSDQFSCQRSCLTGGQQQGGFSRQITL